MHGKAVTVDCSSARLVLGTITKNGPYPINKIQPEESCCLRPELLSGGAVDDEVDGRVEDQKQVV